MKACNALVVIREQGKELSPELAVLAGFAAARNMRVIWVGLPVDLLVQFATVHLFATVDELQKELLRGNDLWPTHSSDFRIAA